MTENNTLHVSILKKEKKTVLNKNSCETIVQESLLDI